jgi:hypothetical protein
MATANQFKAALDKLSAYGSLLKVVADDVFATDLCSLTGECEIDDEDATFKYHELENILRTLQEFVDKYALVEFVDDECEEDLLTIIDGDDQ